MAGDATLQDNLVDSLVEGVIDGLREDLHPQFGVRPYRTFTVSRQWSGKLVGEGISADTEVELRPQPKVEPWNGLDYELEPCGLDLNGFVKLIEVSLKCTQANLDGGGDLGKNAEWFIRLDEAQGREGRSYYFTHAKPPYKDTEKDMGWILWLKAVEI